MPAARVNPSGGLLGPALGQRMEQPAAPIGQVDQAAFGQQCRPAVEHCPEPLDRLQPMAGQFGRIRRPLRPAATPGFPRSPAHPSSAPARRPAASPRPRSRPPARSSRASSNCRSSGSIAGGISSAEFERIERAADPLANIRVADRDQPRQDQPAIARPDERLGYRSHRAIVGKQDAAARQRQRIAAERADQAVRRAHRRSCGARGSNRRAGRRDAGDRTARPQPC